MTKPDLTEAELDMLFDAARQDRPAPSPEFIARITADAEAAVSQAAPLVRPRSVFSEIREVFGGWGGLGGLVTATMAGVWFGVAPPSGLPDPVSFVADFGSDAASVDAWLTGAESDWQEFDDG